MRITLQLKIGDIIHSHELDCDAIRAGARTAEVSEDIEDIGLYSLYSNSLISEINKYCPHVLLSHPKIAKRLLIDPDAALMLAELLEIHLYKLQGKYELQKLQGLIREIPIPGFPDLSLPPAMYGCWLKIGTIEDEDVKDPIHGNGTDSTAGRMEDGGQVSHPPQVQEVDPIGETPVKRKRNRRRNRPVQ